MYNAKYMREWRRKKRKEGWKPNPPTKEQRQRWNKTYTSKPEVKKRRALYSKMYSPEYSKRASVASKCRDRMRGYRNDPSFVRKESARGRTKYLTRLGLLRKRPCSYCGSLKVDAHHWDYDNAMRVTWLCRSCHTTFHKGGDMPLFEYSCARCGMTTEELSPKHLHKVECAWCGNPEALYVVSAAKFVVHGGANEGKRVKKQLTKRMIDHEKTPRAKEERQARLQTLADKGVPVGYGLRK